MAHRACNGVIEVGAGPTAVGGLKSWELDESADEIDVSEMGACVRAELPGPQRGRLTASAWFTEADAGQALIVVGASLAITAYPLGKVTGRPRRSGTFVILSVAERADVAGAIEFDFTASVDTAGVTKDTVP